MPYIRHGCHKSPTGGVVMVVSASSEAAVETKVSELPFDIETIYLAQFGRIARLIARVVQDPARAEDLAVDVFLKLWRTPKAQGKNTEGWLYRVAIRKGLDELRRRKRRNHYESRLGFGFGQLVKSKRGCAWCLLSSTLAMRNCCSCAATA